MGKTNTVARFLISNGKRGLIICPNTMVTTWACGLSQPGILGKEIAFWHEADNKEPAKMRYILDDPAHEIKYVIMGHTR